MTVITSSPAPATSPEQAFVLPVETGQTSENSETAEPPTDKKKSAKRKTQIQQVEEYLNDKYRFRYNIVRDRIEWGTRYAKRLQPIDDYALNTVIRRMERKANLVVSVDRMKALLKSDFTPVYHPIQDYLKGFESVAVSRPSATIQALANTITLAESAIDRQPIFTVCLTKWLVAAVANVMEPERSANHTCLVLTGEQGVFKTTWLDLLCPPDLQTYLFTGKIDLRTKDTLILLGEKFIINLDDQLRALNKQDAETVKTLITQGTITVRRPYASFASELPRLGSFCASVNGNDFLTDTTGSRRFLPFEVMAIAIDAAKAIDINQVWCEAYHLYKGGYRYWFTQEEITDWFEGNVEFSVQTLEDELLANLYKPALKGEGDFVLSSDIKRCIEVETGHKINERNLARALKKAHFIRYGKKMKNGSSLYGYSVHKLDDVWVNRETS